MRQARAVCCSAAIRSPSSQRRLACRFGKASSRYSSGPAHVSRGIVLHGFAMRSLLLLLGVPDGLVSPLLPRLVPQRALSSPRRPFFLALPRATSACRRRFAPDPLLELLAVCAVRTVRWLTEAHCLPLAVARGRRQWHLWVPCPTVQLTTSCWVLESRRHRKVDLT